MRRLLGVVALVLVVAGAAGAGWWVATNRGSAASADESDAAGGDAASALATVTVERRTLTETEELDGTLGFDGEYQVPGGISGVLTWMAAEGTVVVAGEPLYEVDGSRRASLMYGQRPAWRTLESGVSNGSDVRQLEENLRALGYTRKGDEIDRHWDSDTTAAVKRWQRDHRMTADGVIELGDVVFLPEAFRVTEAAAKLGVPVGPGGAILAGTSTRQMVDVDLAADDRDLLDVGMAVTVELPDHSRLDATVASIGRVAESAPDGQGGTTTTIPVTVTLADPAAAGELDAAPVKVSVVTESRKNVLAVPVQALLALIEGGYAVEVVDRAPTSNASLSPSSSAPAPSSDGSAHTRLVRVEPGLFDSGYVEITATGLEPGDAVVVPS